MYELKPQHRAPQNVAITLTEDYEPKEDKGLDTSEFADLMGEKLKANREGIVRKSTWGTLKMATSVYKKKPTVEEPENDDNPFDR